MAIIAGFSLYASGTIPAFTVVTYTGVQTVFIGKPDTVTDTDGLQCVARMIDVLRPRHSDATVPEGRRRVIAKYMPGEHMGFFRNVTTAAVMVASVAGVAQAQVPVSGSTGGCFGVGCTVASNSSNGLGVSFAGENFSWTAFTVPQTVTLGTMQFNGLFSAADNSFTLGTLFSNPATTPGSGTYAGSVNGFFLFGVGGASVDFDNTPMQYDFAGGSLFLAINDMGTFSSGTHAITGDLSFVPTTTTPEPSSMALLGTGLIGLVPMVRRRRK